MNSKRSRFKTFQDWYTFLNNNTNLTTDPTLVRFECYKEIEALRGRPLIVYTTNFDADPRAPVSIDLNDVDGFTDLVSSIENSDSVDVILHSKGGNPDATERIVSILRSKFNEVHFLIPHSAYSAATMLALSGNSITLHPSATLGPIDPQIDGIPARSIKDGFAKVKEVLKEEGPAAIPAYIPLLEKYSIHLLELCDDADLLSRSLVKDWIQEYLINGCGTTKDKIDQIVDFFADYKLHMTHSRPLVFNKIKDFELPISLADKELAELMWETHILISGFFILTPFVKLFENTNGISWGRNFIPPQTPPNLSQSINE